MDEVLQAAANAVETKSEVAGVSKEAVVKAAAAAVDSFEEI